MQQAWIGIRLGVLPFLFPDRERLDADARLQKYVVSEIGHSQLRCSWFVDRPRATSNGLGLAHCIIIRANAVMKVRDCKDDKA